jgi:hypothetical protein
MKTMSKTVILAGFLLLAGCAGAQVVEPVRIPNPPRPIISLNYQAMLIQAGPETAREALKHELDWLNYSDKVEMRLKP